MVRLLRDLERAENKIKILVSNWVLFLHNTCWVISNVVLCQSVELGNRLRDLKLRRCGGVEVTARGAQNNHHRNQHK